MSGRGGASATGLRVLVIASAYPRAAGDVITPWLGETIRRLHATGVDVEVLAPAYRGHGSHTVDGVRVHRFRYAPARWERLTHEQTAPDRVREQPAYLALAPGYLAAGTLAAVRLACSGRFDVVHVLWPLPHGLFGVAARWVSGVPLVCTFFGVELRWLAARSRTMRVALRALVARSDAVTAIAGSTARELAALVPGVRAEVIPFGAAVPTPATSPDEWSRAPNRDHAGAFALLFVGRLVERKGVHTLLAALATPTGAAGTRPVHLEVVGDGPERARLEALASRLGVAERVRFHGVVPADVLARHYTAADAFVLPAVVDAKGDTEGLGVVLVEALAHGVPVIASATGGIPDVVRDGVTGLLVPPGDVPALARAIGQLAGDPARAGRLAAEGRRQVEDGFGWPGIVARLEAVYADARHRHGAGLAAAVDRLAERVRAVGAEVHLGLEVVDDRVDAAVRGPSESRRSGRA